jgi:putative ABC transport system permease protein
MTLREWWTRMRGTLRRDDALEREMEREMAFHLEMSARRNMERGMTPEAAMREAKLAFGGADDMRESARDATRARVAENLIGDIRYAVRGLRRSPSFALAAILTVGLGIGASTAIFSVVDAVLVRPLPIPRPEDFTYVGWEWKKGNDVPSLTSLQFEFVRDHNRSLEVVASYRTDEATIGTAESPPVRGLRVTDGFFRTVGFAPRLGRAFVADELKTGGPPVVILGDAIWRTRFGADQNIVGRQIRLADEVRTVVGVLPPEFNFPPAVQHDGYLVPFAVHGDPGDEGHNTEAIARVRRGIGNTERTADLNALTQAFRTAYPALAAETESFKLFTHRDVNVGGIRRTVWLLFGAVSLLLLIACANTATLMLVRASARQREFAVRAAMGAGPGRILQQLLTEGIVLSVCSAALGVLLGLLALRGFLAVAPSALPQGMTPHIDARVLAYAIAISAFTAVVFGLVAGIPSLRLRVQSGLLAGARGATGGGTRTREMLVFLETSAAVVLLAGATLLIASFTRLMHVDPGFDADRVLAIKLGRLPSDYDPVRRDQLVDRLLARLRAMSEVEHAAAAPNLPLERGQNFPVDTRERPDLAYGATELRFVTPAYFATLGTPLLAGRDFGQEDVEGSEPVAIVNQAFATRFWGDSSPIGRTIQVGHFKDRWINPGLIHQTRVVGVVADMHEVGLDRKPRPTVLLARSQSRDGTPVLLARVAAPRVAASVRTALLAEEPRLALTVEPLSSVVYRSVAGPRFRALLVGTFAGSALLVAAIGIYGVIASVVQLRTREIGIRLALGASRVGVAVGVMRRCLMSVVAGSIVGLATFWALRRLLATMLYNTSTSDLRLLSVSIVVLAIIAALAAWIPTRRAVHIDPALTLRLE